MTLRTLCAAIVLLVACVGLAGCADPASTATPASPSAASHAPVPAAEPAVANDTFGAIAGRVVDDEQQPIASVVIVIVKTLAETRSDAEGLFTFNALEPGSYVLVASRIGYSEASRKVEVVLEESTSVTMTLLPIVIPDAIYHVSLTKTSQMHAGHSMLTWPVHDVGYVNISALLCEACEFVFHFTPGPKQVLSEAVWSAGAPGTNTEVWIAHYKNRTGPSADYAADHAFYLKNRGQTNWSEAYIDKWKGWGLLHAHMHGGLTTVNVEHRVTFWYTFVYNGFLEKDFTALPPA